MSEPVMLSVVNALRDLMRRPSVPVGRTLIDHELNKRRDKEMNIRLNNAIRWLVQSGELLRQATGNEPRWWLADREAPTDNNGDNIPLIKGLDRPFDGTLVDDTKPKRTRTVEVEQPASPAADESTDDLKPSSTVAAQPIVEPEVKGTLDSRIVHAVALLCTASKQPVTQSAVIEAMLAQEAKLADMQNPERLLKMRLSYVCNVQKKILYWAATEDRQAIYWHRDLPLDEVTIATLGPISNNSKPKKASVPKQRDNDPEDETTLLPEQDAAQDPQTQEQLMFTIPDNVEPVWSVDSNGELCCFVDGQYIMMLPPKHAASLSRFIQATKGIYHKESNDV